MQLAQEVERRGLRLEKLEKYRSTHMGYEVFAPEGFQFSEGVHSRVFYDANEVKDFLRHPCATATLPCPADCDCREVEA